MRLIKIKMTNKDLWFRGREGELREHTYFTSKLNTILINNKEQQNFTACDGVMSVLSWNYNSRDTRLFYIVYFSCLPHFLNYTYLDLEFRIRVSTKFSFIKTFSTN